MEKSATNPSERKDASLRLVVPRRLRAEIEEECRKADSSISRFIRIALVEKLTKVKSNIN
jgi:hypothetical protein